MRQRKQRSKGTNGKRRKKDTKRKKKGEEKKLLRTKKRQKMKLKMIFQMARTLLM